MDNSNHALLRNLDHAKATKPANITNNSNLITKTKTLAVADKTPSLIKIHDIAKKRTAIQNICVSTKLMKVPV